MRFLICLIITSILILKFDEFIKENSVRLYWISVIYSLIITIGYAINIGLYLPDIVRKILWDPFVSGRVATSLFVLVMYAGALKNNSSIRKKLMAIRGEMSIIAGILTLGHNFATGQVYLGKMMTEPSKVAGNLKMAAIVSIIMIIVMIPLLITSFYDIRFKMSGKKWKKLQRLSYLFYGLIYVHVLLIYLPISREGDLSAWINVMIYSVIFIVYGAMRIRKSMVRRKLSFCMAPILAALILFPAVLFLGLPSQVASAKMTEMIGVMKPKKKVVSYKDGTYEGKGKGYAGPVKVQITVKDERLADIVIISHEEDKPYWKRAEVILEEMKEKSTVDVDSVSGATKSCDGIKDAVKDALKKAER